MKIIKRKKYLIVKYFSFYNSKFSGFKFLLFGVSQRIQVRERKIMAQLWTSPPPTYLHLLNFI